MGQIAPFRMPAGLGVIEHTDAANERISVPVRHSDVADQYVYRFGDKLLARDLCVYVPINR